MRVPFEVVETMEERERVSQTSGSVSFEIRSIVVVLASSAIVRASLFAVGAVLVQEIVTVTVPVFESDPEASSAR